MNEFKIGDIVEFYNTDKTKPYQAIPHDFANTTEHIRMNHRGIIKYGDAYYNTKIPIRIKFIDKINGIIAVEYTEISGQQNKVTLAFWAKYIKLVKRPQKGKWANQKLRTLLETKNFNI